MLPEAFTERMQRLLGEEYTDFLRAMTEEPPRAGLRVNPLKMERARFLQAPPFPVEPIPYTPDGFYHSEEKIGHHPYHHAGILYSQDPGAMSTLAAAPSMRCARALDMCAAPGGKSAQIAAAIGAGGVLVSNEYAAPRAKQLVGNMERLGIGHAIVTNCDGRALADRFPAFFDFILVDAPCSGEGMFRKNPEAIADWSEDKVRECAALQGELLDAAAKMLRDGGVLLYSTCTFSVEENEVQIDNFLTKHPDFQLKEVPPALRAATADGITFPGCRPPDIAKARRFYPHRAAGEGQFLALLYREGDGKRVSVTYPDASTQPSKNEIAALRTFLKDALGDDGLLPRIRNFHGNLVIPPPDMPLPDRAVFAAGCMVGEEKNGRILPHHHFFTTHGSAFRRKIELSLDDERTALYLHGDVIPVENI
jgi:NOL1/NOP2/sun family putative RNA methylase